jgi:sugar phosphate isomerase/epimerase
MKIAIDISLVSEIPNTPHFNSRDWESFIERSSGLGYDGIEILPRSAEEFPAKQLKKILGRYGMELCVIGSGAGKLLKNYTFTDPDTTVRKKAVEYVSSLIQIAGEFNAMVLVGSMQGNIQKDVSKELAMAWLTECIFQLAEISKENHVMLVFEPLNRYETNLINSLRQGCDLICSIPGISNVKLVADLFHMNIEEADMPASIAETKEFIAHYHFADSNRLAPGMGHTDFKSVATAIHSTGYEGYLSVECFTKNNLENTMEKSIDTFKTYFKNQAI